MTNPEEVAFKLVQRGTAQAEIKKVLESMPGVEDVDAIMESVTTKRDENNEVVHRSDNDETKQAKRYGNPQNVTENPKTVTRDMSITGRIQEWLKDSTGTITARECDGDLGFVGQRDKAARRQAFKRLVDDGRLVRVKSRTGTFKIVPPVQEVDKSKVDGTELSLGLPFGLEKYVRIFPKDLIVLAGVSNVGKTALMLNLAWKNRKFDCWYFSSEMGAVKCKDTIGNFHEEPHFDGWPFHFVDDFEDYETIIRPDAINFIDYLEESEGKYYEIPSIERAIQKQLNNGIAFVAIQKQPGRDYAVGGYNTIGKTALYIAMDGGYPETTMIIRKCKTPREGSVYNFKFNFKIDGGINLSSNDRWAREE